MFIVSVVSAVAFTGCYTTTYVTGDAAAGSATAVKNHHVINGLVTLSDPVALENVCPNGAAEITHQHTFVDGLIGILTSVGIQVYKPTTFTVTCSEGSAPAAAPAPEPAPEAAPEAEPEAAPEADAPESPSPEQ
jgi:hypothetical protein